MSWINDIFALIFSWADGVDGSEVIEFGSDGDILNVISEEPVKVILFFGLNRRKRILVIDLAIALLLLYSHQVYRVDFRRDGVLAV